MAKEKTNGNEKMTNRQLMEMLQAIREMETKLEGSIKFKYALAKNSAHCQSEANALSKAIEITHPDLNKYRDEMSSASTGEKETIRERMEAVKVKFPEVLAAIDKQREDEKKLLDEPCTLSFHKIDINEIPGTITPGQLRAIMPMLAGEIK